MGILSLLPLAKGSRLSFSKLLPLVEHRAIALVLLPLTTEHLHEGLLLVEARILLENCLVLELTQSHVLLGFVGERRLFGHKWLVMGDIPRYVLFSLKQVEYAMLMLLQLIDVHVIEVMDAATNWLTLITLCRRRRVYRVTRVRSVTTLNLVPLLLFTFFL